MSRIALRRLFSIFFYDSGSTSKKLFDFWNILKKKKVGSNARKENPEKKRNKRGEQTGPGRNHFLENRKTKIATKIRTGTKTIKASTPKSITFSLFKNKNGSIHSVDASSKSAQKAGLSGLPRHPIIFIITRQTSISARDCFYSETVIRSAALG